MVVPLLGAETGFPLFLRGRTAFGAAKPPGTVSICVSGEFITQAAFVECKRGTGLQFCGQDCAKKKASEPLPLALRSLGPAAF